MSDITAIDQLANDIREVDGDHSLSAGELAEKLVELGYTKAQPVNVHPPLKDYKISEFVEVLHQSDWVAGRISGIQKTGNVLLYVDTERGPVTVAGPLRVRKVVS